MKKKIEILTDIELSKNDLMVITTLHDELNAYIPVFQEDFEIIYYVDDKTIKYQYNGRDVFECEYEVFDHISLIVCIKDLNYKYKFYNESAFQMFIGDKASVLKGWKNAMANKEYPEWLDRLEE